MKKFVTAVLLATFALSTSALAVTKVRNTDHRGFFIGFGLGYGNVGLDVKNADLSLDREDGFAPIFFIGGALRSDLLLGLDFHGWTRDKDNVTTTTSNSTLCLTYYPSPSFFIKGGIGAANASVDWNTGYYTYSHTESGFGITAGAGFEIRLTRKFALVPSAQWSHQNFDDFTTNFYSIAFNIGWFW